MFSRIFPESMVTIQAWSKQNFIEQAEILSIDYNRMT